MRRLAGLTPAISAYSSEMATEHSKPPLLFAAGTDPRFIAVADLDGDRSLDLVTANASDDNMSVLLNQRRESIVDQRSTGSRGDPLPSEAGGDAVIKAGCLVPTVDVLKTCEPNELAGPPDTTEHASAFPIRSGYLTYNGNMLARGGQPLALSVGQITGLHGRHMIGVLFSEGSQFEIVDLGYHLRRISF